MGGPCFFCSSLFQSLFNQMIDDLDKALDLMDEECAENDKQIASLLGRNADLEDEITKAHKVRRKLMNLTGEED